MILQKSCFIRQRPTNNMNSVSCLVVNTNFQTTFQLFPNIEVRKVSRQDNKEDPTYGGKSQNQGDHHDVISPLLVSPFLFLRCLCFSQNDSLHKNTDLQAEICFGEAVKVGSHQETFQVIFLRGGEGVRKIFGWEGHFSRVFFFPSSF